MIASLRGQITARGADHVTLEVGGVGYKVFVPRHPTAAAPLLYTHQVVREDGQFLYGFETQEELALFELLIAVSGVGPRAGLAILSVSRPADVAAAIGAGDVAALARAPGVGKKTAERLIVDLRGKVSALGGLSTNISLDPVSDEAQAALQALGFSPAEAAQALRGAPPADQATSEERLSYALRTAARR